MIEIALDGDRELMKKSIGALAANSNALHLLFDGFATVFTYEDESGSRCPISGHGRWRLVWTRLKVDRTADPNTAGTTT